MRPGLSFLTTSKPRPFNARSGIGCGPFHRETTYNYSEAAKAIGQPKAARAVARACASNPAALIIPCHRIVPKAGGVGGYRWQPDRKKKIVTPGIQRLINNKRVTAGRQKQRPVKNQFKFFFPFHVFIEITFLFKE